MSKEEARLLREDVQISRSRQQFEIYQSYLRRYRLYMFDNENIALVSYLPVPIVERSEKEIAQMIKRRVERIEGVKAYRQLNVRMTAKRLYVEMQVFLDRNLRFEDAHKISLNIEREVKNLVPNARVSIHTEPFERGRENIWKLVKEIAEGVRGSRGIHNIHVLRSNGKISIDLHMEVSANMTVKATHDVADEVERKIKVANHNISGVTVHVESASDRISREMAGVETELKSYIEDIAGRFPEIKRIHGIRIYKIGDTLNLALHCHFDPSFNIENAHQVTMNLENEIKKEYPKIVRIDVHEEPD